MSTDDTTDPAAGGNLIAAEYVLGVLGAEERREVERRLAQEPALASEVAFWEERLGGLASELGLDGFIVELNPGGLLPMDRMLRTLRILTHEVLPAIR